MKIGTKTIYAIAILLLTAGFSSCIDKEEFPLEPVIELIDVAKIQNTSGVDDKALIKISYTDGDGNIGLDQGDTIGDFAPGKEFYYNFFVKYFEKINGEFVEIELPLPLNGRIPKLDENAEGLDIKGEIQMETFINNYSSPNDTIQLQIYIADRSLKKSNVVTTQPIIIKKF